MGLSWKGGLDPQQDSTHNLQQAPSGDDIVSLLVKKTPLHCIKCKAVHTVRDVLPRYIKIKIKKKKEAVKKKKNGIDRRFHSDIVTLIFQNLRVHLYPVLSTCALSGGDMEFVCISPPNNKTLSHLLEAQYQSLPSYSRSA